MVFLDPDKPIEKHRINLPHWQQDEAWIFVTCRLADSLPEKVIKKLILERKLWLHKHPKPWDGEAQKEYNRLFTLHFEDLLDDAHGSCVLRKPELSEIIANTFHHFNRERYDLNSYVVMPNHVHVLFRPLEDHRLEDIIHTWKRFTAREINKAMKRTGPLWQREYWDRLIRSQKHFDWTSNYIRKNPAKLPPATFRFWKYGEGV
jgi:type I restriction enzyme R subunit